MRIVLVILSVSACLLCYLLIPVFEKFAKNHGYLTVPKLQKIDTRRLPYFGGVVMFCVFLLLVVGAYVTFRFEIDFYKLVVFILATSIIVLFGLYDDIRELKPVYKFAGQCLGAFIFVLFCMRTEIIYLSPMLNIAVSLLWITIIINAFNLLDIMDGLAGGISLINISALFLFGLFTNNHFVILIASILMGVLVGFLRYNLPPARIFMGDAGSQFLGFSQAILAISLSFTKSGHEIGLVIPLVILALPLFDLLFVILMRARQKKVIYLKSNDHFVFRMLKAGMSSSNILKVMLGASLFTAVCAMFIYRVSNNIGALIFFVLIGSLFLFGLKLSSLKMSE